MAQSILDEAPGAGEQQQQQDPGAGGEQQQQQQQQIGEYDFSTLIGKDGSLAENWRDALPDDLRNEPCLANYKHIGAALKSLVHAQKAIGAEKLVIPGPNATAEEHAAFYQKLGRPESADKYEFTGKLPDGFKLDDAEVKAFRDYAFQHGLSKDAYNALVSYDIERMGRMQQAQQAAADAAYDAELNATESKLKTELGPKFGESISQYRKAIEFFGVKDLLMSKGLINNYDVIKAFIDIGGRISESRLKGGAESIVNNSPDIRYQEIMGNPDHAYFKADHPGHDAAVSEVARLLALKDKNKQNGQ